MYVEIMEEDTVGMSDESIAKAVTITLKKTQNFLTNESLKRLGIKMKIRRKALKNRIKKSKIKKGGRASVWFGFMPVPLDTLRDYYQTTAGVVSGGDEYKGAFSQVVRGASLVWSRWVERKKATKRKKRNKNGSRVLERDRRYKSKIERVYVSLEYVYTGVIKKVETLTIQFFNETLNNELLKQHGTVFDAP